MPDRVYLTRAQVQRLVEAFFVSDEESLSIAHADDDRIEVKFNYLDPHRSYERFVTSEGKVELFDPDHDMYVDSVGLKPVTFAPREGWYFTVNDGQRVRHTYVY